MDGQREYVGPVGYVFAVAENPFCCWDFDHGSRTLDFLEGLGPEHFGTVASLLANELESDDAMAVSVMLRVVYHQALETLMSMLGAAVQAPVAVPAWIARCSTSDLASVVVSLRDGRPLLTQNGRRSMTFDAASKHLHRF